MEALLTLNNVEFKQSDRWTVRIRKGEEITMKLLGAAPGLVWTTGPNDSVLTVTEEGPDTAKVVASNKGESRVLLLNASDSAVFRLTFDVQDPEEAGAFEVPDPVFSPIQ